MLNFYYIDPQFLRGMAEALTSDPEAELTESQDIPRIHFNLLMEHLTDWQVDGSLMSLQDAAIALMNLYRVAKPPTDEYEIELDESAGPPAEPADSTVTGPETGEFEREAQIQKTTAGEFLKNLFGVKSA